MRFSSASASPKRARGSSPRVEVLSLVTDPQLAEQVRQLVAAAGRVLVECHPAAVRREWRTAGVVVLDVEAARLCGAERLAPSARRSQAVTALVTGDPTPQEAWRLAVHAGADHVLALPSGERELVRLIGDQAERCQGKGKVVAVVGARGGAGASTLAAATALVAARRGERSLAVDLDPLGGGLDLVLGMEREPGMRWGDLALSSGRVSAAALHEAVPSLKGRLSALSFGGCSASSLSGRSAPGAGGRDESARDDRVGTQAVLSVLDSARLAGDIVVVDLPRRWEDLQQAVVEAADMVVMVLPAELRSIAAGRDFAAKITERCAHVAAVVRGPAPGGLRLARAAAEAELPMIAVMHHDQAVAMSVERGGLVLRRRSSVLRAAEAVLGLLGRGGGA